jgi:1-deoxy-D-xylulose-5-phosphate synthase
VHKLLTGRRERFGTMRQYQGLNGFLLRTESEHDCYGAGHAGTAMSAALGMAVGRDRRGSDEHVVVVAGDAAFTCGVTYEALNNVAEQTKRFIVVLNDNEWSIAKNVGAIASYFNKIATHPTYAHLHEKAAQFIGMIGGKFAVDLRTKSRPCEKSAAPSVIFEELGLRYYGPIDGHDVSLLTRTFEFLKTQNEPVLLHILTQKGKGYAPALEQPDKFHGLGNSSRRPARPRRPSTPTYSEIFGKTLAKFAESNNKIVAITGAMPSAPGSFISPRRIPDKYFDVGIAEEHAALFAAASRRKGFKPFLAIYSTFMQRAYDMLIHDIALQNLNVALCMDRGGLSGDDGPTHHGLFDIGYLRHIPNLVHMQPKDEEEFVDMLWTMPLTTTAHRDPLSARRGHGAKPEGSAAAARDRKSRSRQTRHAGRVDWLGRNVRDGREAAALLEEQGISAAVINPRWIKPLDAGRSSSLRAVPMWSARSKITSCTTVSAARSSSISTTPASRLRSCASAGPITSSSTAPWTSCGKSTASQRKPPSRKILRCSKLGNLAPSLRRAWPERVYFAAFSEARYSTRLTKSSWLSAWFRPLGIIEVVSFSRFAIWFLANLVATPPGSASTSSSAVSLRTIPRPMPPSFKASCVLSNPMLSPLFGLMIASKICSFGSFAPISLNAGPKSAPLSPMRWQVTQELSTRS